MTALDEYIMVVPVLSLPYRELVVTAVEGIAEVDTVLSWANLLFKHGGGSVVCV